MSPVSKCQASQDSLENSAVYSSVQLNAAQLSMDLSVCKMLCEVTKDNCAQPGQGICLEASVA